MLITYLKKHPLSSGAGVLIILTAAYFLTLTPRPKEQEIVRAARKDLVQEVFVTGTVKTERTASLSFDRSGRVTELPIAAGVAVEKGTILAALERNSEEAAVAEAEAAAERAGAALRETERGTRREELAVKESAAAESEVSLQNLLLKTTALLADAYGKAEESLNRYADPLFTNDETAAPLLSFAHQSQAAYDANAQRVAAGMRLASLKRLIADEREAETRLADGLSALADIFGLFLTIDDALKNGGGLEAGTLAGYQERVGAARAKLVDARLSLENHRNAIRAARAELARAQNELALARAGATEEERTRAEETFREARARVAGAGAALEKTRLRAPFRGSIAARNVEIGETVSAGTPVIDFFGTGSFVIEAKVPEADVTKIKIGDTARATLDAYGDSVIFIARVREIESSATEVEGVPTYKTTFAIEQTGGRPPAIQPELRAGLTVNLTLVSIVKKSALAIPARGLDAEGSESFATAKRTDGREERVRVVTGARAGREVEIVEGLAEGDRIIIPKPQSE